MTIGARLWCAGIAWFVAGATLGIILLPQVSKEAASWISALVCTPCGFVGVYQGVMIKAEAGGHPGG